PRARPSTLPTPWSPPRSRRGWWSRRRATPRSRGPASAGDLVQPRPRLPLRSDILRGPGSRILPGHGDEEEGQEGNEEDSGAQGYRQACQAAGEEEAGRGPQARRQEEARAQGRAGPSRREAREDREG